MAANKDIVKYIKDQVDAGFGKEEIYLALVKAGWQKEEINQALYEIMGKSPEKPSSPKGQAQPELKAPSKSHSRRNVLIIAGAIIFVIVILFVFFRDTLFSALRAIGLPV